MTAQYGTTADVAPDDSGYNPEQEYGYDAQQGGQAYDAGAAQDAASQDVAGTDIAMREAKDGAYGVEQHSAVDEAVNAFDQLNLNHDDQNGYAEEDSFTRDAEDSTAAPEEPAHHAATDDVLEHTQPDAVQQEQSAGWNAYDEEGGQESQASSYDPYAPYNSQQQQELQPYGESSEPPSSYDPYSADAQAYAPGNETGLTAEEHGGVHAAGEEDDADARTPLASRGENGSWLGAGSSGYDATQDPYSPVAAAADSPYAPASIPAATSSYGGYEPYGPPSGNDRSFDPYAADDSHTHAQHGPASNVDDAYANNGPSRELPSHGDYFEPHQRAGSPQQYGYGSSSYALPPSPYEPHDQYAASNSDNAGQGPRSVASEPRSQTASETSTDMLQTMRSATIPIASFGIGGKLVSYFPTSRGASVNEGNAYSYSSSSYPTTVNVQALSSLVPSSAYASAFDPLTFPGPIFEGAAGTNALSRATGAASANKTKKAALIKHIDERVKELLAGVGYLRRRPSFTGSATGSKNGASEQDGELEARRTEDKVCCCDCSSCWSRTMVRRAPPLSNKVCDRLLLRQNRTTPLLLRPPRVHSPYRSPPRPKAMVQTQVS